eukprot:4709620-Amphidinium_carterae.1
MLMQRFGLGRLATVGAMAFQSLGFGVFLAIVCLSEARNAAFLPKVAGKSSSVGGDSFKTTKLCVGCVNQTVALLESSPSVTSMSPGAENELKENLQNFQALRLFLNAYRKTLAGVRLDYRGYPPPTAYDP